MATLPRLSEHELFLLTVPDDTEDAPWMVMGDLQVRDIDLLKPILLLHVERHQLPWYLASYLKITAPRPVTGRPLDAAPDLLMVEAEDRLRTSWNIVQEGKAPQFVLEVAAERSWDRDFKDKPLIYDGMGVREYALFAPERKDGGPLLSGYRRDASGAFVAWDADAAGVLWSRELGLGLYVEHGLWLRAVDHEGRRLPTPREWAREEAARAEAAQAVASAAAADADAARATAEVAQAAANAVQAAADDAIAGAEARAAAAEAAKVAAEARAAAAEAARATAEADRVAEAARRAAAEAAQAEETARRIAAEHEVTRLREELRRLRGEPG